MASPSIPASRSRDDSYSLTPLQQGMLAHHLRAPHSGVDVEQLVCTLPEVVDAAVMRRAWQSVVDRHEVLRSAIEWTGLDAPRQRVLDHVEVPFAVSDCRGVPASSRDEHLAEWLREDRARGFELERAPLLRIALLSFVDDDHRLVWSFHHAILDGRCFPMVLSEVFDAYDAATRGAPAPVAQSRRPFREYVRWLEGRDATASDDFWRGMLARLSSATPIPVARAVPLRDTIVQGDAERWVSAEIVTALREVAAANQVTLNTVVQGAWALVLSRYSGERDVVFGVTSAGRRGTVDGADDMLGLFINTLPMRVSVNDDATVGAWLRDVRSTWNAVRAHEHTPLARVHACSAVPAGQPLFDSLVMFESYELEAALRAKGGAWSRRGFRLHEQNGFPLTLAAYASDRMLLRLEFDRTRFEDAVVARMLEHLATGLESIARQQIDGEGAEGTAESAEVHVGALSILPDLERLQLLEDFAGERVSYSGGDTLVERMLAQVSRTPSAIACADERRTLSYAALDRAATALARRLRALGVGRGVLVGVCAERSVEMVVALVAVVKAGGAYVPIDPEYPSERVAFMLEDSSVAVLLVTRATTEIVSALAPSGAKVISLDGAAEAGDAVDIDSAGEPLPLPRADDPAYMIYTSGSTGRPKGALNAHRGIVNRLAWMQAEYQLTPDDVVLQKTPFSFDVSVWEFFWPLMTGARLVLARPGGHRDTTYLAQLMRRERVTVCHFVPSMLRAFLADAEAGASGSLRAVMASGEALAPDLVGQFYATLPAARLHNLYGPTECAVDVSYWPCPPATTPPAVVPIGRPVANTRLYVLDARNELVPIGVPGELYLAGVQVGLGYHNRPELTAERFVLDVYAPREGDEVNDAVTPHSPLQTGRPLMYRTGDRARWLADGTVEYLGRLDFQVKLRGFRIELGEIETTLLKHPGVRDCVVDARASEGSEKRLVGYVVSAGDAPAPAELKRHLLETLPDYMVPGAFVFLDALPLSSNGKVDRRALPDPSVERAARARGYEAPSTPAERALTEIWSRVLRVERVGVNDDFFELGGDSLLSIQIVSQATRAGFKLTLTQVLQHPTVAGQARVAQAVAVDGARAAESESRGELALTPVQRWFAELNTPDAHHWNQAFLFTVPASLDHARLDRALSVVAAHHDALRLRFARDDAGAWRQWFADDARGSLSLSRVNLTAARDENLSRLIAEASDTAQASLDLEHGPIGRAVYFDLGPARDGRLLLVLHHLVVDGVSWRLLREDIESAYEQLGAGSTAVLPAKTSGFATWSAALARLAASPELVAETEYWAAQNPQSSVLLPVDRPAGENVEGAVRVVELTLSAEETRDLLQRVPSAYGTQINDALVAALGGALSDWLGAGSVVVDLEGHGREELGMGLDVSRTVGWFTTVFPARLELAPGLSPRARLIAAKEQLRRMPRRGLGYGALRYLRDEPVLRGAAQAEVMFNYLGQFDQVVAGSRLFGFARESAGAWRSARSTRRHRLEINALVLDGRLTVRFGYADTMYDAATVQRLAESFGAALRGCIAHCLAPDAGGYTPSDFPLAALDQAALDRMFGRSASGARDVEDVYPLTPLQRLFFDAGSGATDPGFQQYRFDLEGDVDVELLRAAWDAVLARHDVLRARFVADERGAGGALQIVQRQVELPMRVEDWRGAAEPDARFATLLREDRARGFDFGRAPLMRISLVRTSDARWTMVWTQHHLLLDRWSWPIVLREVGATYDAMRRGATAALSPAVPFREYVRWLGEQPDAKAEAFWREELAEIGEPMRLLDSATAGATGPAEHDEISVELSASDTAALRALAREKGLSANVLVQGAWSAALAALASRDDVTFGLAVDGRGAEVAGVADIVGVLINNVPVRARLDAGAIVADWLAGLQRRQAERRAAEHASPEAIQRWSGLAWRHRLFETLLVFQDQSAESGMREWFGESLGVGNVVTPTTTAYPITGLVGGDDRLTLTVLGDRRQVPRALAERVARGTEAVLLAMTSAGGLGMTIGALRKAAAIEPWAASLEAPSRAEYVEPRTGTERVLARIWGDLLGASALGVTDNFFARGGHSLLATQIVSRVRETFHAELPVRVLFQGPTVAEMAGALTAMERKPGQTERIAQMVLRVEAMSADELRQSAAAREAQARQTVTANGN